MSLPAYIQAHAEGTYVAIRLQPRASRDEIGPAIGLELKVRVTAPPVEAAANDALVRLLAERLGCPRGAVQLVRGHTSRHKVVFVRGVSATEVAERLGR